VIYGIDNCIATLALRAKTVGISFKEKQEQIKQVCKVMSKGFILNKMATCSSSSLFVLCDVFAVCVCWKGACVAEQAPCAG
jgi:hypothetical protein